MTFNYSCGVNTVIERYVQTSGNTSVWIQVRGTDTEQLQQVLGSATYG
jgi:hypothetical protein